MNIIFIAIGLAMDAFAVSIASGTTIQQIRISHAFRIGLFFGVFQAGMPIIGWLVGTHVRDIISEVDHWIAFSILILIGGKMIYESFRMTSIEKKINPLKLSVLFVLAVATSIDALAVGVTFALLRVSIFMPVVIIGGVTFLLSVVGVLMGDWLGHLFENKMVFIGGLVLIGIGIKILIEH